MYNLPFASYRRQWKFQLENDVWKVVNDRIYTEQQLIKAIKRLNPVAIFYSTSLWLEPRNIERKSYKKADKIWLGNPELVFDIDGEDLKYCAKIAKKITKYISTYQDYTFLEYHFTGSKGYRVIFKDNVHYKNLDDFKFKRKMLCLLVCKNIKQKYGKQARPLDCEITTDPYRIIRLPGSVHPSTGLKCSVIRDPERHAKNMLMKPKIPQNNSEEVQHTGLRTSSFLSLSSNIPKSKEHIFVATVKNEDWNAYILNKLQAMGVTYVVLYKLKNHLMILSPQKVSLAKYLKLLKLIKASNYSTVKKYSHYRFRISSIKGSEIKRPEQYYIRMIGNEEVSEPHIKELKLPETSCMIKKGQHTLKYIVVKE